MTFASRVDVLAGIVLASCALSVPACVAGGVFLLSTSVGGAITFFACAVAMAALIFGIAWPVRYELGERELVIRFGAVRARVAYADIEQVSPTRSLLAAPALSRDRLEIRARGNDALISPRDPEGFLAALAEREPGLVRDGARLLRR